MLTRAFISLFDRSSSTKNSQAAKLRCILNYFDRLADLDMEDFTGQISYARQVRAVGLG